MRTKSFDIFSFSETTLYEAISNEYLDASEIALQDKISYLYQYLQEINTETIIVEHDYTDGDYLDDFAAYYVKCFASYKRKCKRLHFFSVKISVEELLAAIRGTLEPVKDQKIKEGYSGFLIVRPLPDAIIGRTILKVYDNDNGRRNYTCTRKYQANLFGIELEVLSLAFQEQDTVVAACATVSLWCCFHKTAELFGTPLPTPAFITRTANQVVHPGRPLPSHGLIVQQMCSAIRQVGLESEVVQVKNNTALISLIYGHLRMGLPVIVGVLIEGIGYHAITLTGYSLKNKPIHNREVAGSTDCIPMRGLRIDEFYAHDDQIGPFSRLRIKPSVTIGVKAYPISFEGSWRDASTGKFLALYPDVVVIPVYHKIRVTFIDLQIWLTRLHKVTSLIFMPSDPLEWDLHLITSNNYKKESKSSQLPLNNLEELLIRQHPRFIWRAVLRYSDISILEILADATDMARSFPIYHVSWYSEKFKDTFREILGASQLKSTLSGILTKKFFDCLMKSIN